MTADEVTTVYRQLHDRIAALLTPDQLGQYHDYQERVKHDITRATPGEQAVLDIIAADQQASALDRQLNILLRVTTPPQ